MRQRLFTKEIDNKLFNQYKFGNDLSKQMVVAKIFNPYSRGTWYLLNSDPNDPDYIWAIVDLFEAEVGSVSREDLETIKVPPFGLNLERDIYFQPINAQELLNRVMQGERFADGGATDLQIVKNEQQENFLTTDNARPNEMAIKLGSGGSVEQGNLEMVKNQAIQIDHHAKELKDALKSNPRVDGWVVSLTDRATSNLSDVTHYLEGQNNKFADGGMMGVSGETDGEYVAINVDNGNGGMFEGGGMPSIGGTSFSDVDLSVSNLNTSFGNGGVMDKSDLEGLIGLTFQLDLEGNGGSSEHKIVDIRVTPPSYRHRDLFIMTSDGSEDRIPMDKVRDFLDNEQITLKDSKGDGYAITLIDLFEPKVVRTQFEEEEFEYGDGGMVNRDLNIYAKKRAETLGVTPQKMKSDYELALKQSLIAGLTDANFHSEAKKLVSIFENEEWSESLWSSIYWDAEDNVRDLGVDIANKSEWDGYDVAMAFKFIAQMNGLQKLASQIDKAMGQTMANGGQVAKNYIVEYEINGVKHTSTYLLYPNDRVENLLPPIAKIISIKEKMASGGEVYKFNVYLYNDDEDRTIKEKKEYKVKASSRNSAYDKANKKFPRPYFVELYSIDKMEKGGSVKKDIDGYVVFFNRFADRGRGTYPRIIEYHKNLEEAENSIASMKDKKGMKVKELYKMPTNSMVNISDKDDYSKVKNYLHSIDKVNAFFEGKDSFFKRDFSWVKPQGYDWDNWQLEKMANGGVAKKYNSLSKEEREELMREHIGIGRTPYIEYEKYEKLSPYHKELVDKHLSKKMASGGKTTFKDKVSAIKSKLLKSKKVSPKVQSEYGKTYNKKEAEDSAKRIVGAMRKKEMSKKKS